MNTQPPIQRLSDMLGLSLDRSYAQAVKPLLSQLAIDPRLAAALKAFQTEAERLHNDNQPLTADNPSLLYLRQVVQSVLHRQTATIERTAQALQEGAVQTAAQATRQLAFPGVNDQHMRTIGVEWKRPAPDAVLRLVNYAQSPAWNKSLDQYGSGVAQKIYNIALSGVVDGQNPREIARTVTQSITTISRAEAEKLIRTLQLASYRQASAANYAANEDKIDYLIRIEALDDRCCLSCIALHGTRLEVGESVDEHWNGRGTAIPVIKGFDRDIPSGEDWFNGLDEDHQREIMGDAAFNAWSDDAVSLNDFIEHTTDPIFGSMIEEASLKGILGADEARKYYSRNYASN